MVDYVENKSRINTKDFIGGKQSDHPHIITGIINFEAVTYLSAESDIKYDITQPLIFRQMGKMDDLLSSEYFGRYMANYNSEKHVPHALLVQCQSIFAAMETIAESTRLQNMVISKKPILVAAYSEAIYHFEENYRNSKRSMNNSTLVIYQQVPRSYIPLSPRKR